MGALKNINECISQPDARLHLEAGRQALKVVKATTGAGCERAALALASDSFRAALGLLPEPQTRDYCMRGLARKFEKLQTDLAQVPPLPSLLQQSLADLTAAPLPVDCRWSLPVLQAMRAAHLDPRQKKEWSVLAVACSQVSEEARQGHASRVTLRALQDAWSELQDTALQRYRFAVLQQKLQPVVRQLIDDLLGPQRSIAYENAAMMSLRDTIAVVRPACLIVFDVSSFIVSQLAPRGTAVHAVLRSDASAPLAAALHGIDAAHAEHFAPLVKLLKEALQCVSPIVMRDAAAAETMLVADLTTVFNRVAKEAVAAAIRVYKERFDARQMNKIIAMITPDLKDKFRQAIPQRFASLHQDVSELIVGQALQNGLSRFWEGFLAHFLCEPQSALPRATKPTTDPCMRTKTFFRHVRDMRLYSLLDKEFTETPFRSAEVQEAATAVRRVLQTCGGKKSEELNDAFMLRLSQQADAATLDVMSNPTTLQRAALAAAQIRQLQTRKASAAAARVSWLCQRENQRLRPALVKSLLGASRNLAILPLFVSRASAAELGAALQQMEALTPACPAAVATIRERLAELNSLQHER